MSLDNLSDVDLIEAICERVDVLTEEEREYAFFLYRWMLTLSALPAKDRTKVESIYLRLSRE